MSTYVIICFIVEIAKTTWHIQVKSQKKWHVALGISFVIYDIITDSSYYQSYQQVTTKLLPIYVTVPNTYLFKGLFTMIRPRPSSALCIIFVIYNQNISLCLWWLAQVTTKLLPSYVLQGLCTMTRPGRSRAAAWWPAGSSRRVRSMALCPCPYGRTSTTLTGTTSWLARMSLSVRFMLTCACMSYYYDELCKNSNTCQQLSLQATHTVIYSISKYLLLLIVYIVIV